MKFHIPGFSFWALVTAAVVFTMLLSLNAPKPLLIMTTVTWYLAGYGVAYAVRRFHYPVYEEHGAHSTTAVTGVAPEGMLTVNFLNQQKTIFVEPKANLRKTAKSQGVQMYYDVDKLFNCQGFGLCGTCRFVPDAKAKDAFSDLTWQEKFTLGDNAGKLRLACQTHILGDCTVDNTAAREIGEVHHYSVINGVLFGVFSLIIFAVIIWIGGDMVGLF